MSKLKKENEEVKEPSKPVAADPPAVLTPWQKENLEYLKKQGEQPSWQPEVIENKTYRADAVKDSEIEEDVEGIEEVEEEANVDDAPSVSLKELPKSESFADKLPKMKQERRHQLIRRLSFLIGLFGIAALGMLYYISPLSKLGAVMVTGNENIETEKIVSASKYKTGEALWSQYFDKSKVTTHLKKEFPRIKTVKISLTSFNQFIITVHERPVVAYMLKDGEYYPILENGITLKEKTKQPKGNYPILSDFQDKAVLMKLLAAYEEIPAEIRSNISEIHATPTSSNPYLITLYMNDKNQVIASIKDVAKKIVYYPKVAAMMNESGVIDMEAGVFSEKYGNNEQTENKDQE